MPRNSSGVYTLPDGYLATTGQTILASQHNPALEDLGVAITGSVPRNGTSGMLANLPMGGFKATNMADGVAASDSATVGQASALASTAITTAPTKTTPVDADSLPIVDSVGSNTLKRLTWANLKVALQATFQLPTPAQSLWSGGGSTTEASISPTKLITAVQSLAMPGLSVVVTSATSVTVTSTNGINVSAALTTSGVNGLDTGAEASNTFYYVWVIWSSSTGGAAALLSTSSTAPTMPAGYVQKVRVGAVRNDASSNLWRTRQLGRRAQIVVGTNPTGMPVMASGNAGSVTTPTWVAVSVSPFVPATASEIYVTPVASAPGGDGTGFMVAPNDSYGARNSTSNPPTFTWTWVQMWGVGVFPPVNMVLESTNIYWANTSGASIEITMSGWVDNL